jgi:hypothetical protein
MKKRLVQTGFSLSGIAVGLVFAGVGLKVLATQGASPAPAAQVGQAAPGTQRGQGRGQRGPAAPPAPCGPNIAGDLGKNTDQDSRCFELRMYTVDPSRDGVGQFKGGINELHKRFREGEVEVFKQSGVQVLATWQNLDDPNMLIYLLAYKDRAARDAGWAKFNADPKWTELRTKYFVPLNAKAIMMSATDYSPLK